MPAKTTIPTVREIFFSIRRLCLVTLAVTLFQCAAASGNIISDTLFLPDLDEVEADDSISCILPFNRIGNLIIIKAKVDSIEGNFILDTGAPGLVLNLTYFRQYEQHIQSEEQTSITAGTSALSTIKIDKLTIGDFKYHYLTADVANLGNIENARGIKIIGLLGVGLFRKCEMIIDFENGLLHLTQVSKKQSQFYKHAFLQETSSYEEFPIEIYENRIYLTTNVGDRKLKMVVDCAAETSMLDSRLPDKVFQNMSVLGKVKLVGVGNKKVDALLGNISDMKIGNYPMGNMVVTVSNLERTCFADGGCDGVIGFNFLSLHKIGFNFVTRRLYIWK